MNWQDKAPSQVIASFVLTGDDLKASNSFDAPNKVAPQLSQTSHLERTHEVRSAGTLLHRDSVGRMYLGRESNMMIVADFIRNSALGAGTFLSPGIPFAAATSCGPIHALRFLLGETLGTISPNIYGHFAENLSGVIYDGIWVGENSKVPNVNGIRKELIDEMRKIKPPVVRFPGGCFADSYDWRDGVGPADKRPRRTNFWAEGESATAPASHKLRSQSVRHQ